MLTAEINFLSACNGNTVTITLAPGVSYIPGSSVKTGGSAGITIADLGGTANAPTFSINGVSTAGSLRFSIKRIAGCGSTSNGKDVLSVSGSCGTVTEQDLNINSYNLLSPALALTPPPTLVNAFAGQTSSRTITITNGGNGCIDTLRYYVVYASGGIINTNAGNAVTVNGAAFMPYATGGDTLYYKIYGNAAFGPDGLFCNGESAAIIENIKVVACNAQTSYGAGWGRPGTPLCQSAAGNAAVTMATGVANISAAFNRVQQLNWCQNGIFTITYTNNGSGSNAGGAYNILANIGYNGTGNATAPAGNFSGNLGRIDSVKIGTVVVPLVPATATVAAQAGFSGLSSDPDGMAAGLDDLDGDGQYDDLAPGKSVTITVYEHWVALSAACPTPAYGFFTSHTISYKNMCGAAFTSNPLTAGGAYRILSNSGGNITAPAEVTSGVPFTIQACINLASYSAPFAPKDSLYFDMILPAGLSLAAIPNVQYNGVASTYYVDTVAGIRTLHIKRKSKPSAFCFSADVQYDCSAGSSISPQISIWYQGDTCSGSVERYMCKTSMIKVSCPGPCPDGITNYLPVVKRLSLGYTSADMTGKVAPAAVKGLAVFTALPLDTIQIIVPGRQSAITGSFNNLYYNLQLGRAGSADVLQFIGGTFNQVSGAVITSNAMSIPATAGSTSSLQKMQWNLSSNLATGTISTGDSIWLDMRFVVTRANNDLLYAGTLTQAPNTASTLYNVNAVNARVGCDTAHAINLLLTGNTASNYTPAVIISNCNAAATSSNSYHGNGTGSDIFPNEYRPGVIIDSVLVTLPGGYSLMPSNMSFSSSYWASLTAYGNYPSTSNIVVAQTSPTTWMLKNPYMASTGWPLADLGNSSLSNNRLSYQIAPTCASVTGTQPYSAKWYYRDFVYTGNTAAYVSKNYTVSTTITYNATVVPSLTLQNNTGVVQGVLPQHYWDVQLNSSGTGTPQYVWMALDRTGSGISIDSVVYDGTNITGAALSYGAAKQWYKLTASGINSGVSKAARVYFRYGNCTSDSIKMLAGWNCTAYPSPDPAANSCSEISQYLKVIPQNSQVQITVDRQPGNGGTISLCSQDSVMVIVNSAQAANLVDPDVVIYPPAGITFTSTVATEYPLGSGNWQNITPVAVSGGGYRISLSGHSGINANGLPGTALNPAAGGRQARLKLIYSTSCAVVSGTQLDFIVHGNKPCGTIADGDGLDAKSNPVSITGASTTGNAVIGMSLSGSTTFTCGTVRTLSSSVTEVGTATQAGDTVVYKIPAGLVYSGNFNGCASCGITTIPGTAGSTLVKIAVPAGLASGTATGYSFDIAATGHGGCTASQIEAQVERSIGGLSCGAMTCSSSKVIIGTATPAPVTINKPTIAINSMTLVNGSWMPGTNPTVAVTYRNTGAAAAPANTYISEYFCGGNTTPFATHTFVKALAVNAAATDTFVLSVPFPTCGNGDALTAKVQALTAANVRQCICSPASYTLGTPLPVHFTELSAKTDGCAVTVSWSYEAINTEVSYLEIQRSADGHTFIPLSRQHTPAGSYTDAADRSGHRQYRILAVSADGNQQYSDILPVTVHCEALSGQLLLYPNPSEKNSQVLLDFTSVKPYSQAMIRCTDITGRMVLEQQVEIFEGANTIKLQTGTLRPGTYLVSLYDRQSRMVPPVKMVITK